MKLPINLTDESRLSFHLNALLAHPLKEWVYERFINVQYSYSRGGSLNYIDNQRKMLCRTIYSEHVCLSLEEARRRETLIDDIAALLMKQHYCYVWADKFYLPDAVEYQKFHYAHPVVIYGCDEAAEVFHILNFHGVTGNYEITASRGELLDALLHVTGKLDGSNMMAERELIAACKVAPLPGKHFDIGYFTGELGNYLFSRCEDSQVITSRLRCVFGIGTYDKLIEVNNNYPSMPFKTIFDWEYHKEALVNRFHFLQERYRFDDAVTRHMRELEPLLHTMARMRLLAMKCSMKQGRSPAADITSERFKERFAAAMAECRELEYRALIPIYRALAAGDFEIRRGGETAVPIPVEKYRASTDGGRIELCLEQPIFLRYVKLRRPDSHWTGEHVIGRITVNGGQQYLFHMSNKSEILVGIGLEQVNHVQIEACTACSDFESYQVELFCQRTSKRWDFSTADAYEWETNSHISEVNMEENMNFKVIGADPILSCWDVQVDAEKAQYVEIVMKNSCDAEVGQLFFTTHTEPAFTGQMHKSFVVASDGEFYKYIVDCTDNERWTGIIAALRLDPVGYDNKSPDGCAAVKSIEVFERLPIYASEEMFCPVQGINGWSYHYTLADVSQRAMVYSEADQRWRHPRFEDVYISGVTQSSAHHFGVIRRWTCQAAGAYIVRMTVRRLSPCENVYASVRHNQQSIFEAELRETGEDGLQYVSERIFMKYGDFLDFKTANRAAATCEEMQVEIAIEKIGAQA